MADRDVSRLVVINGVGALALVGAMVFTEVRLEKRFDALEQKIMTRVSTVEGSSALGGRIENLERKAAVMPNAALSPPPGFQPPAAPTGTVAPPPRP